MGRMGRGRGINPLPIPEANNLTIYRKGDKKMKNYENCAVEIVSVLAIPAIYQYSDADYSYWLSIDGKTLYCLINN